MNFTALKKAARPGIAVAVLFALVGPLAAPLSALADDPDLPYTNGPSAPSADANTDTTDGVGVARLSVVDGDVAIQRGDAGGTTAAVVNAPVLGADYLTTGDNSRAELQFDGNTMVRLGSGVQLRVAKIDAGERTIQLAAGTIDVRLLGGVDGQTAIDTPSISIEPRTSGTYRITVDDNGDTAVTVRSGHADIATQQGTQALDPGSTLVASGPASNPQVQSEAAIAYDDFDAFNQSRDAEAQRAVADAPYVNQQIDGVGDLPSYGKWVPDSSYGQVWIPNNVGPNWAPYQNGNWVWEDSYGWTWVAAEPWGWAPYHYGRWYYSTAYSSWAWYPPRPGRYAPAWSPALVGFVGFNIGAVSVGIGFGNVGWVPLAPYEAFHPWWGPHGTTVINNVTINNNRTVYRNMYAHNGFTAVSVQNFQAGRFNQHVAMEPGSWQTAHVYAVRGALPVVPTQANLRFTERAGGSLAPVRSTAFVQHFAGSPSVAPRTPFAQQQASFEHQAGFQTPGRGFAGSAASQQRGVAAPAGGGNDPWSRFNANRGNANGYAPHGYGYSNGAPSYARPSYGQSQERGTYARPTAGQSQERNTYSRPSYGQSYSRPSYGQSYSRPSYGQSYSRPSYGQSYSRPSYSQSQARSTYSRPSSTSHGAQPSSGHASGGGSHEHSH